MGDVKGFMQIARETPSTRPVSDRLKDHREVYKEFPIENYRQQGARCMDCGVPFCQSESGCPLGNLIPEWNDMVFRGRWQEALQLLTKTNNFPEFTGRICPAPCEGACVLGLRNPPVTIRNIEVIIAEKGFENGWLKPNTSIKRTGKKVAIVGSGPAGLAAADQLNSVGHSVTVYEKSDRVGGLLMYGIPHFKLDKSVVKRRIKLMEDEGVVFKTNAHVGVDVSPDELRKNNDALILCGGAQKPRDLAVEGRELDGIHFAMDFLPQQNKRNEGDSISEKTAVSAKGKNVLVIGGGDTGSDCIGTSLRQGAKNIYQFELLPQPPKSRAETNPWPQWPAILRVTSSHEEAQKQVTQYCVSTKKFSGKGGKVAKVHAVRVMFGDRDPKTGRQEILEVPGSEFELEVELVLIAMGFLHPIHEGMIKDLGLKLDPRGNVWTDPDKMTSVEGIYSAGDMARGQSLVVWAIAEGREVAHSVDLRLMGKTILPHSQFLK